MNSTLQMVLAATVGIVIGAGSVQLFSSDRDARLAGSQYPTQDVPSMQNEMNSLMRGLDGTTGDTFDKAFLAEMIVHHQGAIAMAERALQNAKHPEIKALAQNIITAQNAEIKQMQNWQTEWYGASSTPR
ncbi:MAG: DUF305 domain-containing protein [Minisyncoccota bacterium]